jgi:biopolymer transport protein ExbD
MHLNLRPHRRPVPAIPIVSLIDIMIILLIFFIATTTFRDETKQVREEKTHLKIQLPESESMGAEGVDKGQERKSISLTQDQKIFLDGQLVPAENLAQELARMKKAQPEMKLELEADTTSQLGILVKVWDALRVAGYSIQDVPARIQRR